MPACRSLRQPRRLLLTSSDAAQLRNHALQASVQTSHIVLAVGPGTLIGRGLEKAALWIEPAVNRLAPSIGKGPEAVTKNIETIFRRTSEELVLMHLHRYLRGDLSATPNQDICEIKRECRKLIVHYINQRETNSALFQTFQSIVYLATRYPGLRTMFLRSVAVGNPDLKQQISALQMHANNDFSSTKWHFFKAFALTALSHNRVNTMIDQTSPEDLGLPSNSEGLCTIERLLGFARDASLNEVGTKGEDTRISLLAVRYLSAILQRASIWSLDESLRPSHHQMHLLEKLIDGAVQLFEDIPPDVDRNNSVDLDVDGLDAFLRVLLTGPRLHGWMAQPEWRRCRWSDRYGTLINLLQSADCNALFPLATASVHIIDPVEAWATSETVYTRSQEEVGNEQIELDANTGAKAQFVGGSNTSGARLEISARLVSFRPFKSLKRLSSSFNRFFSAQDRNPDPLASPGGSFIGFLHLEPPLPSPLDEPVEVAPPPSRPLFALTPLGAIHEPDASPEFVKQALIRRSDELSRHPSCINSKDDENLLWQCLKTHSRVIVGFAPILPQVPSHGSNARKRFMCIFPGCKRTLSSRQRLLLHLENHLKIRAVLCTECNCRLAGDLPRHWKLVHRMCDKCRAPVAEDHTITHTPACTYWKRRQKVSTIDLDTPLNALMALDLSELTGLFGQSTESLRAQERPEPEWNQTASQQSQTYTG